MSREHKQHQHSGSAGSADSGSGGLDMRQMAMMKRAQDRKSAAAEKSPAELQEARGLIRNKCTHEAKETCYEALDIFQAMERADERNEAKLDAQLGHVLADKAADFLTDHMLDFAKDAFELGESAIGGAVGPVYSGIKGAIEGSIKLEGKLTRSELVDHVVKAARHAVDMVTERAGAAIDALPDERVAEIAGVLDAFNEVQSASDSPDTGSLKHGLQQWMLEKMGAPKTGGAAAHVEAMGLYRTFQAEVRKTETVSEQVDEIAEEKAHPNATEEKAEKAEEKIGADEDVKKDESERARVETEAG